MTLVRGAGERSIGTREIVERDPEGLAYDINIQYPRIESSDEGSIREVNAHVAGFATGIVEHFRKEAVAAVANDEQRRFRAEHKTCDSLEGRFDVSLLTERLLSLRFIIWTQGAGAIHPNTYTHTLNFLLSPFQQLRFQDLFRPESDYLGAVSEYCVSDLRRQVATRPPGKPVPQDDSWLVEGAGPKESNFEAYLLTKTGLLLIFDPYRVGSYAEGSQEVHIPVEVLRQFLDTRILAAFQAPRYNRKAEGS
jgi:Protein of unknown function (DUF3298)